LHATAGRKFLVFNYVGCVSAGLEDEVNPIKGGGRVWIWDADPFPWLRVAGTFVQAPRDAGGDGLLASPVGRVVVHPEFGEALPVFLLRVPQLRRITRTNLIGSLKVFRNFPWGPGSRNRPSPPITCKYASEHTCLCSILQVPLLTSFKINFRFIPAPNGYNIINGMKKAASIL